MEGYLPDDYIAIQHTCGAPAVWVRPWLRGVDAARSSDALHLDGSRVDVCSRPRCDSCGEPFALRLNFTRKAA